MHDGYNRRLLTYRQRSDVYSHHLWQRVKPYIFPSFWVYRWPSWCHCQVERRSQVTPVTLNVLRKVEDQTNSRSFWAKKFRTILHRRTATLTEILSFKGSFSSERLAYSRLLHATRDKRRCQAKSWIPLGIDLREASIIRLWTRFLSPVDRETLLRGIFRLHKLLNTRACTVRRVIFPSLLFTRLQPVEDLYETRIFAEQIGRVRPEFYSLLSRKYSRRGKKEVSRNIRERRGFFGGEGFSKENFQGLFPGRAIFIKRTSTITVIYALWRCRMFRG